MKKIFIGLLIIAAGAGVYYFLPTKKAVDENKIHKELLIGKWKLDTLSIHPHDSTTGLAIGLLGMIDSNFYTYHYDFKQDGHILQSLHDSVTADTSYYEWNNNELLIQEEVKDSAKETFTIATLNSDSLVILSKDSSSFVFSKLK